MSIKITSHKKEVEKALRDAIDGGLEAVGIQAEKYAKLNLETAPRRVDTGLLRNSITYVVAGQSAHISTYKADTGDGHGGYNGAISKEETPVVYIGTNVEYAPYVHEGTSKMTPNRFLKNAAQGHEQEYQRIVQAHLKG